MKILAYVGAFASATVVLILAVHRFVDLDYRYPERPLTTDAPELDERILSPNFRIIFGESYEPRGVDFTACPFGFAKVESASPYRVDRPLVHWTALVPVGGVFPYAQGVAVYRSCERVRQLSHRAPEVGALVYLEDHTGLAIAPGDVLIPLRGEATLAQSRAIAYLDADSAEGRAPSVTVVLAEVVPGDAENPERAGRAAVRSPPPTVFHTLHARDTFAWSDRTATIARIVEPDPSEFGPIGWIEVRLSGAPPAHAADGERARSRM